MIPVSSALKLSVGDEVLNQVGVGESVQTPRPLKLGIGSQYLNQVTAHSTYYSISSYNCISKLDL